MATQMLLPAQVELKRETLGSLTLIVRTEDGTRTHTGVEVKPAFPLSGDKAIISFRGPDGKEIGVLKNATALDEESLRALDEVLKVAYFVPKITRIENIEEEYGVVRWVVETDRGRREFSVQSRHDIRQTGPNRYLIKDIDGNRFEIPDARSLDPSSRAFLEFEV